MSITSVSTVIAILCALILYYVIPKKFRWVVLFIVSTYFVVAENGLVLAIVSFGMIAWTYLAGILISQNSNKSHLSKAILITSIIGIVLSLIIFKESIFFINTANQILKFIPTIKRFSYFDIIAPLGISYFSLTLISYVCEVYWNTVEVQRNPLKFLTYGLYFPILTSGPILKYKESSDDILMGHSFEYKNLCFGLQRIFWGLFKKMVISDRIAVLVNTIYDSSEKYVGVYVLIAALMFTLQLYTDFSGCIDIFMGVSELFGVKLPENFDKPFLAKTIAEFWRKWHITLGIWLKEYVLYPILKATLFQKMGSFCKKRFGKKVGKKIPTWIGLLISWFLIGLWHGGGYNYIFGVGLYMGFIIIFSEILEPAFAWLKKILRINEEAFSWKLFQIIRTYCLFSFGLSFFRAESVPKGINMWKSFRYNLNPWILFDGSMENLGLSRYDFRVLQISILVLAISGILPMLTGKKLREWISEQNMIFRWMLWIALVLSILVFGKYGPGYNASQFIYGMF